MAKRAKPRAQKGKGKTSKPEDEAALWNAFTQNIDQLTLKGRVTDTDQDLMDAMLRGESARLGQKQTSIGVAANTVAPLAQSATDRKNSAAAPTPQKDEIDARQVRRIGKGRAGIDARIDLHGMRQTEAHAALRVFLFGAVAKGHRMVLVITGKGTSARPEPGDERFGAFVNEGALGRGVLRRNVPLWLAEPDLRAIVVGYTAAHIRHGGEGALYVQLRRRK